MKCWCKCQGFLVAFYFPTVYRQFLDLQQYGWIYRCNGLQTHKRRALYVRIQDFAKGDGGLLEVFTNSQQNKNANITNFVLAVPPEMNKTKEVYNVEI